MGWGGILSARFYMGGDYMGGDYMGGATKKKVVKFKTPDARKKEGCNSTCGTN